MQEIEEKDQSNWAQILHPPRPIGSMVVVDRTADVVKTAEMIAIAAFSFRGESPYSPHVVLVNEYICDHFLSALAAHVISSKPGTQSHLTNVKGSTKLPLMHSQKGTTFTEKANIKEIISGSNGSIFEVLSR